MRSALVIAAGLCGAAGAALAAVAAHSGLADSATAAQFLLFHAAALLAIGLVGGRWALLRGAGLILLIGIVLFAGDLTARDFLGGRLFPMAAPIGGSLMIVGWLAVALAGVFGHPSDRFGG